MGGKLRVAATIVAALTCGLAAVGPSRADDPPDPLVLAYTRGIDVDGDGIFKGGSVEELATDVYARNVADPLAPEVMINLPNTRADITPSFSPDGTKIAWASNATPSGSFDILVRDVTTGVITNLTNTPVGINERWPNWSSDGSRLVYVRRTGSNNLDVWTMAADGTDQRFVAGQPGSNAKAEDCCADFLAGDLDVVFASNRSGNFDLYRYSLRGPISSVEDPSLLTRMTSLKAYEGTPEVEASGAVLYRNGQTQQVIRKVPGVMVPTVALTPTGGGVGARTPTGSPDGLSIAYGWYSARGRQLDLVVAAADGAGAVNMTNTPDISETDPSWWPGMPDAPPAQSLLIASQLQ